MKFDLIRPCKICPFRTDCLEGWLGAARAQEIVHGIAVEDKTFSCHETTQGSFDEETDEYVPRPAEQHCAGALIMLDKAGVGPGQLARIAGRLGQWSPDRMDMNSPVFDTTEGFVRHHAGEDSEEGECCAICNHGCEAPAGYMAGGTAVSNYVEPDSTHPCPGGCGNYVCDNCEPDCWCQQGDEEDLT